MIRVGSIWISADHKQFTVRGLEQRGDDLWVSYGQHGNDRTYECLSGAFLHRFEELKI